MRNFYKKVEYLGHIEYDFQKSHVTGPLDHKVLVSKKKLKNRARSLPMRFLLIFYLVV
jgi:hypothetical protein